MSDARFFDVIVVGGGPGGSVAAKKCAEGGLKTLLVEKRRFPRDKVCSGMVMGRWARQIIEEEFGRIPESVLTNPAFLCGQRFYVDGAEVQELEWDTAFAWRRDLDFWMVQRAEASGVAVRDDCRVLRVRYSSGICHVHVQEKGKDEELQARFVIGADGATSVVRRSVFPALRVRYSGPIRECYRGQLNLEKDFFHWFFPKCAPRPRFDVNFKGDVFLIEGAGVRELRNEIKKILLRYGFDPETKPQWTDGCAVPILHSSLLSGSFQPAKKNVLLVGDAAGLILPITFEGIGSALKSGVLAAKAIVENFDNGRMAVSSYLKSLYPMFNIIRRLCRIENELRDESKKGAGFLAKALRNAYLTALTIQES